MTARFDHTTMAPLTGTVLRAEVGTTAVELQVVEVTEPVERDGYESFSVLLRGPAELLPQAAYRMVPTGGGAFDLFVVPIGQDAGGTDYEAVFSRRVEDPVAEGAP